MPLTPLATLAAERTDLSAPELDQLEALLADWSLLADLAFADLLLWLPTWNDTGFIVAAQVRPSTARTHIPDDLVGHFAPKGRHFELDRAFSSGQVAYGAPKPEHDVTMAIPVRFAGKTIAVIGRYAGISQPGRLESMYAQLTDVLTEMVVAGHFPKRSGNDQGTGGRGGAPRIGDGLIVLDKAAAISFASPNARSAFRRLGIAIDIEGQPLADLVSRLNRRGVPVDDTLALVANGRIQGTAEVEGASAAVTLRSIPLIRDGAAFGTIVMVRDVSDLRRREKALLGKDAAIREIHHRVKNNLQTVASLLRLQGRRLGDPVAQAAIAEAVRRVGTIAVVHDLLAHDPGEVVNFNDVAARVVGLTIETAAPIQAKYSLEKNFGELPSEKATPLALVLAELVANAVEHAGADRAEVNFQVGSTRKTSSIEIEVVDDGPGIELPVDTSRGLGLSIVTTLVRDELKGEIEFSHVAPHGTKVCLEIPLVTS